MSRLAVVGLVGFVSAFAALVIYAATAAGDEDER